MTDNSPVEFIAQQMPDGKWRLTKRNVNMGVFDTQKDAEAAMQRILNPVIAHYDEKGSPIK